MKTVILAAFAALSLGVGVANAQATSPQTTDTQTTNTPTAGTATSQPSANQFKTTTDAGGWG
ncbi:MAG: hypothetical protein QOH05_1674 [Acetobacteraceae bacterium]|jgi:hypothetical protein|nr:hypothetical protein [Acetobacteraceae bacterium]